jgi:hypothetical protein
MNERSQEELLQRFIGAVEKIAFEIPAPNPYTPRFIQCCIDMRMRSRPMPGKRAREALATAPREAVLDILSSPLGCVYLGRKYGVDKKQIQRVRRGESWTRTN